MKQRSYIATGLAILVGGALVLIPEPATTATGLAILAGTFVLAKE
jgi:UPF0716 family protein affecting phage T7 exclusion